ncbi:hypothetical protein PanWU01x14_070710 [Parasponia andersonii]|uniref:Uncharacterized protein n=1 Tax=Parasponia andersonii TaxID=3476 RepID=A0A2P5DF30_PARAD|nr:hypothetical protein PanWU01x14_070710 [Parasponia andersonii]
MGLPKELRGSLRIGECVGKGLLVLNEHPIVGVGDLDSIIEYLIVGGREHESDHRLGLERPQCPTLWTVDRRTIASAAVPTSIYV